MRLEPLSRVNSVLLFTLAPDERNAPVRHSEIGYLDSQLVQSVTESFMSFPGRFRHDLLHELDEGVGIVSSSPHSAGGLLSLLSYGFRYEDRAGRRRGLVSGLWLRLTPRSGEPGPGSEVPYGHNGLLARLIGEVGLSQSPGLCGDMRLGFQPGETALSPIWQPTPAKNLGDDTGLFSP
ncbi:hypothetical protein HKX48_005135 [Thoreauomyces humboldtii]|nr:hypothetical protein HKX48_005135 [Thoreauomyces humboldtii]